MPTFRMRVYFELDCLALPLHFDSLSSVTIASISSSSTTDSELALYSRTRLCNRWQHMDSLDFTFFYWAIFFDLTLIGTKRRRWRKKMREKLSHFSLLDRTSFVKSQHWLARAHRIVDIVILKPFSTHILSRRVEKVASKWGNHY